MNDTTIVDVLQTAQRENRALTDDEVTWIKGNWIIGDGTPTYDSPDLNSTAGANSYATDEQRKQLGLLYDGV